MSHTPGPWQFVVEHDDCGDNFIVRMGEAIASPYDHDAHLAFTYYEGATRKTKGAKEQYAEAKANVRLIAAAPDLLAALKLAQLWLANCVPTTHLDGPKPLPVIADALAKAEG